MQVTSARSPRVQKEELRNARHQALDPDRCGAPASASSCRFRGWFFALVDLRRDGRQDHWNYRARFFQSCDGVWPSPHPNRGAAASALALPSGKEWSGTRLLFDLAEQKGQTLLRFTHADWQAETDYFIACTTTWGELMFRIKAVAEGKAPGPLFSKTGMAY